MQLRRIDLSASIVQTTMIALLALAAGLAEAQTPSPTPTPSASPASTKAKPQTPSPEPENPQQTIQEAVNKATSAANIVQTAQSSDDWKLVANQWEEAIDLLRDVPPFHPKKSWAKQKIAEYQRNLVYAKERKNGIFRAEIQQQFFNCMGDAAANPQNVSSAVLEATAKQCVKQLAATDPTGNVSFQLTQQLVNDTAKNAAKLAKSAQYPEDWDRVASQWQQAIALLKSVPSAHPKKGWASNKIVEYQRNLAVAQQQKGGEYIRKQMSQCVDDGFASLEQYSVLAFDAIATLCVNKMAAFNKSGDIRFPQTVRLAGESATNAGTLAKTARYSDQWNLIISQWQRAIALLKAVSPSHPTRDLAETKIGQYRSNLNAAKQKKSNVLRQEIRQQIVTCLDDAISNLEEISRATFFGTAVQCMREVVLLQPDGRLRPDANEREIAWMKLAGLTLIKPASQGQGFVQLKRNQGSLTLSVPVTIGGKTRTFLLDTGASHSVVDTQIAQSLRLPRMPIARDLSLGIGTQRSDIPAMVVKLPALFVDSAKVETLIGKGMPKASLPGNLSGILGMDFLSGFDVALNPKSLQLQLLPPTNPSSGGIPLEGKIGIMTTQVYVNGQGPFTFLLDTGADVMVVSDRLAQQLALEVTNETVIRGVFGNQLASKSKLNKVKIKEHEATNLDTVILNSSFLDQAGVDGIVGQPFLNRYQQYWRFGQRNELGFAEEGSLTLSPL